MKRENVDGLYTKYNKAVPKDKRQELKKSLENAEDSKYERVANIGLASKNPVRSLNGGIAFFATLFLVVFIVFNLLVFLFVTPKFTAYSNYSAKIGDGLQTQLIKLNDSGTATFKSAELFKSQERAIDYEGRYKSFVDNGNNLARATQEYNSDAAFVANKSGNYLKVKVELVKVNSDIAKLDPNAEDYESKKQELEAKKTELEGRITDYETRSAGLAAKYTALEATLETYRTAAEDFKAATEEMNEWVIDVWLPSVHDTDTYVNSLNAIQPEGIESISSYMKACRNDMEAKIDSLDTLSAEYEKNKSVWDNLPTLEAENASNLQAVKNNYTEALSGFKAYALKVANFRVEYDNYVKDNSLQHEINVKLAADLNEVQKEDECIAVKAKELLSSYKGASDAATDDKLAKGVYDALYAAINGKTDAEVPQIVKDLSSQCAAAAKTYEVKVEEYETDITNHNAVLKLFNLTNYADLLYRRLNLTVQIAEETDEAKKQELQTALDNLNEGITAEEEKVYIYQTVADDATWTDDYYVTFCNMNVSEGAAEHNEYKEAYEMLQNAAKTVGNAESVKIISDNHSGLAAFGVYGKSDYERLTAYYSAEQSAMRLQAAINYSNGLLEDVSDYYKEVDRTGKMDWVEVSEDARSTVLKKVNLDGYVANLNRKIAQIEVIDLADVRFKVYDFEKARENANEVYVSMNVQGKENSTNKITLYDNAVKEVVDFRDAAYQAASDYNLPPEILGTILMVYNIIITVIAAAYFIYLICDGVSVAKNKNYEKIKEALE